METITMERHEAYVPEDNPTSGYGGARTPYLDEIIFVSVPEAGARIAGLETGEYDFIEGVSLADYDLVSDNPNLGFDPIMQWMPIICFNTTNAPMDDIWLRRAIGAAIGSAECMLAATFGHPEFSNSTNASLFFPAQEKWLTPAADPYWGEPNPSLVSEYLEKSDYNGETLTFFTTKDYPYFFECAVVVQDQLKRVGINVELEVLEWSTAVARFLRDEPWHFFSTAFSPRAFPDAYLISLLSTGGLNARRTGWANAAIDALLEADAVTLDDTVRYQIWEAITVLLRTYDFNHVKLGDLYGLNGRQSYVKGTMQNYSISHFYDVWLEK
jgi:peptide/nickel transport system substrate-binding protein